MKQIYKIELKRAFSGKRLLIALGIGMMISICHLILWLPEVVSTAKYLDTEKQGLYYPLTVFYGWIGANTITWQQYLYFLLFPLLASLPYGVSLFEDRKNGFIKNILTKCRKRDYYRAKYISVFLTGGFVVVIPLIFNLLVCMMFLPTICPEITTNNYSVTSQTMFASIFYSYPLLYLSIYLVIDFIFGGLLATISLLVCDMTEYKFVVEAAPLFVYIFIFSLFDLLGRYELCPLYFLNPSFPRSSTIGVFTEMIVLFGITSGYTVWKGKRDEIF